MGFEFCPANCELVSNPYDAVDSLGLQGLLVKGDWRPDISHYMKPADLGHPSSIGQNVTIPDKEIHLFLAGNAGPYR